MTRRFFLLVAIVLAGCSGSKDIATAEQAVLRFHELLDSGEFTEIYERSSDDLKNASSQTDFLALLEAVHRKLGTTKSAVKQGWTVNYRTSGTFVTLTYGTLYTEGEAAEQFVYRIQDGVATLAGYHVNSNTLILK